MWYWIKVIFVFGSYVLKFLLEFIVYLKEYYNLKSKFWEYGGKIVIFEFFKEI